MTVNRTVHQNIEYSPSLIGRFARIFIPFIESNLSPKAYRIIYDFLYSSYKKVLKAKYFVRVLKARFIGDYEQKLKTSLTWLLFPYSMGGWKALENAFEVTALAEKKKIEGALVECGVAEGGTAAMMALTNREIGTIFRPKWFFDSYEGLPEPTAEDYEGGKTGHFIRPLPKGACLGTIEQVSNLMFDKLRFSAKEVNLVKGWFQDTVPVHRKKIGPIAVLRLDGDWYESTKIPLDNFYDQITPGGYVIIDDYGTCFGSRKAVEEFREERKVYTPLISDGRGGVWFSKPEIS
jgi:O-methyltransferase